MDVCEDCGLDLDAVALEEIAPRVAAGVAAVVELLEADGERATLRPSPERWSVLEYTSHVRDVLLTMRDRTVIGIVEDDPGFKPLYRDQRVDLGLYTADTAVEIVPELRAATAMYLRVFAALDAPQRARIVEYGFPHPQTKTILWMGQQAVHEVEHHLADLRENVRLLA